MLAKSKLHSIETLISQALIDLDISHEEFKTIAKKKKSMNIIKKKLESWKVVFLGKNNKGIRENRGNAENQKNYTNITCIKCLKLVLKHLLKLYLQHNR